MDREDYRRYSDEALDAAFYQLNGELISLELSLFFCRRYKIEKSHDLSVALRDAFQRRDNMQKLVTNEMERRRREKNV